MESICAGQAVTSHPPGILDRLIWADGAEPRISPALLISRDAKSMKSRNPSDGEAFFDVLPWAEADSWFVGIIAIAEIATSSRQEAKALEFIGTYIQERRERYKVIFIGERLESPGTRGRY